MSVLGIRCSNRDFSYAVLDGTKKSPQLPEVKTIPYPKGFAESQSLQWLYHEIDELRKKYMFDKIVIKRSEGQTRGRAFEERVEHEATVMLAAADHGIKAVFKKVKSTIAKDLGQKGWARYLSNLDTSGFPNFSLLTEKQREAVLAGWSELS
ncbi:MAG: hypothetical protein HYS38_01005 [Acidobacteria bacterium]|nr:hypothetical protein [Acidobacteriota bacterium]